MDNTEKKPEMPQLVRLNFHDSKVPEFKEVRGKDWILFGEDNMYPDYLIGLYNKSSKHGAIINSKAKYIFGQGLKSRSNSAAKSPVVNRSGETLDFIMKKGVKDGEIHGGFKLIIIWSAEGGIADIFHYDFKHFRKAKDGGYYWKKDWKDSKEKPVYYKAFNDKERVGAQVFAYNEYRPGTDVYPLPEYLPCNNYIETDIEISKYNLSCIKNGMMPSKFIQMYTGAAEPTTEIKKDLERRWKDKFTGSENGGSIIIAWAKSKEQSIDITDLSNTESDKLFDNLNKTCQQEIITGHQIVSPMLFGIKTEGQLGGTNELKTAYSIFINTYAKPKQQDYEEIVNYFGGIAKWGNDFQFEQLDPVDVVISIDAVADKLPNDYILDKVGVPKEYRAPIEVGANQKIIDALSSLSPLVATKVLDNLTNNETRGLINLAPVEGGDIIPDPLGQAQGGLPAAASGEMSDPVNENIKNLTAKQHQQLMRIIRQYTKGQLTLDQAKLLIKTGLGLGDTEINILLGIEENPPVKFSKEYTDDEILEMFAACGQLRQEYFVIHGKKVSFESDDEALDDELNFYEQAFKKINVSSVESQILDLIRKDPKITPEIIAKALKLNPEYITAKIATLTKDGLIESNEVRTGEDVQIERKVTKPAKDIIPTKGDTPNTEILIKYSYEGPMDSRNRPFCRKLMEMDKLYSRYEIEQISQRLGYSVFDRRGGFWRHKDGTITPYCRHFFKSNIVVKKGGTAR